MRQEITDKLQADGTPSWIVRTFDFIDVVKRTSIKTVVKGYEHTAYTVVFDNENNPVLENVEICISTELVFEDPSIHKKNEIINVVKSLTADELIELKLLLK